MIFLCYTCWYKWKNLASFLFYYCIYIGKGVVLWTACKMKSRCTCLQEKRSFWGTGKRYERRYSLAYRLTIIITMPLIWLKKFSAFVSVLDKFDGDWNFSLGCIALLQTFVIMFWRKPKEATSLDNVIEFVSDQDSQPEDNRKQRDQETVHKAITELPENLLPMVLRYLEIYHIQISAAMDLPVSTIETRLYREELCCKKLGRILERGQKGGQEARVKCLYLIKSFRLPKRKPSWPFIIVSWVQFRIQHRNRDP